MTRHNIRTPISEQEVRKLVTNDIVYINGTIITARDAAHKKALDFKKSGLNLPVNLEGLAIFHSGPIVKEENNEWKIVAAGPTTSSRMDLFEDEFIKNFKIRIVIGKGNMGKKTVEAMKKYGAIYTIFTGGAAVLGTKGIKKVKGVEWRDLGMPEAMWILEVENFGPLIVAIDAHGNNLFEEIKMKVNKRKPIIYRKMGL